MNTKFRKYSIKFKKRRREIAYSFSFDSSFHFVSTGTLSMFRCFSSMFPHINKQICTCVLCHRSTLNNLEAQHNKKMKEKKGEEDKIFQSLPFLDWIAHDGLSTIHFKASQTVESLVGGLHWSSLAFIKYNIIPCNINRKSHHIHSQCVHSKHDSFSKNKTQIKYERRRKVNFTFYEHFSLIWNAGSIGTEHRYRDREFHSFILMSENVQIVNHLGFSFSSKAFSMSSSRSDFIT